MSIVHGEWCDLQVFQHRKLVFHSLDDLLQTRKRHDKAYASHAITVLEGKHDPLFIFGGEGVIMVIVKNDKWKGRGMSEHFYHGRAR
jgi:hypothetical protein